MDIENRIYGKGITLDNYCASHETEPEDYDLKSIGSTIRSRFLFNITGDGVASGEFVEEIPENAEAVIGYDSQIFSTTCSSESDKIFYRIERGDVLIPKKTLSS